MHQDLLESVALVAGATRGAGRGIALELGAAAPPSTARDARRASRSRPCSVPRRSRRPPSSSLLREAAGSPCRSTTPGSTRSPRSSPASPPSRTGRLDVLVNSLWGGDPLTSWKRSFWEHSLADGLEIQRHAVGAHLITAWHALPLMVARGRGLVVEMTDGDGERYGGALFYDLAKASNVRIAHDLAVDLRPHGVAAIALRAGVPALRGGARPLPGDRGRPGATRSRRTSTSPGPRRRASSGGWSRRLPPIPGSCASAAGRCTRARSPRSTGSTTSTAADRTGSSYFATLDL